MDVASRSGTPPAPPDRPGEPGPAPPPAAAAARPGPRPGDAFGALLLACLEHGAAPGRVFELIERDDGFLRAIDAVRYFAGPAVWGPLDHWACDRARGRVLDVGSGAGRHTLHLQARGLDVVALDVSPLAAEVCRLRGARHVVVGTVFDLAGGPAPTGGPFDTFLLLGNNLGLLQSAEHAPRFLHALAALAAPGAAVVGRGMDPYATVNPLHLAYHQRNRTLGRLGGQIRMRIRHEDLATDWFDYLFATPAELQQLLAGTPWRLEHIEPARDGEGPGATRPGYVAVLRLGDGGA